MSVSNGARPAIVQPGEGKAIDFGPVRGASVLLAGEQTGGALAALLVNTPPGGGPPLHAHARDDELFLVIEGTIGYFYDGEWTDVGAGGAVYLPRGTPHRFRNNGTASTRHWVITAPSGFEEFFAQTAVEVTRPGGPNLERLADLHTAYGYTLLDEAQHIPSGTAHSERGESMTMSADNPAQPTIVQPGEGKQMAGPGSFVMLGGQQTGGSLAVVLGNVPPGSGPPLHVHGRDDELFLVIEGTISYFCDGEWTDVGAGGAVFFPKGTPHLFRNRGTMPARHWILTTPSGFEHFLPRFNDELTRPGGPDRERIVALHAEYGYTLLDEAPRDADEGA